MVVSSQPPGSVSRSVVSLQPLRSDYVAEEETITSGELAEMLGISQTAVNKMISKSPTFPTPVVSRVRFRAWSRSEVEAWLDRYRPEWRGEDSPAPSGEPAE